MKRIVLSIVLLFVTQLGRAEELKQLVDVAYGNHPRQVLDFYQAESDTPTPVVFYIHGGGNQSGASSGGGDDGPTFNGQPLVEQAEVVVVTINYRLGALGFLETSTRVEAGAREQPTHHRGVRHVRAVDPAGSIRRVVVLAKSTFVTRNHCPFESQGGVGANQ